MSIRSLQIIVFSTALLFGFSEIQAQNSTDCSKYMESNCNQHRGCLWRSDTKAGCVGGTGVPIDCGGTLGFADQKTCESVKPAPGSCHWSTVCSGKDPSCSWKVDQNNCEQQKGCTWGEKRCVGSFYCSMLVDKTNCQNQTKNGCNWQEKGVGTCTARSK